MLAQVLNRLARRRTDVVPAEFHDAAGLYLHRVIPGNHDALWFEVSFLLQLFLQGGGGGVDEAQIQEGELLGLRSRIAAQTGENCAVPSRS